MCRNDTIFTDEQCKMMFSECTSLDSVPDLSEGKEALEILADEISIIHAICGK